ncbi:MAG: hypothetical protein U0457_00415 [Candidatus Sericytochromatia bacterium]
MFKKSCLFALCLALVQTQVNVAYAADKKPTPINNTKSGIAPLVKFENDPDININLSNASVSDVLKALTEQAGYNLVITSKIGDDNIPRIEFTKMKLSEAFTLLLKIKNLSVKKIGKTLFVADSKQLNDIGLSDSVIKTYKISNMKASEASEKIKEFYVAPNLPPKIISSDTTSTLTAIGRPNEIEYLDMVMPSIDIPVPQVMIEIKLIEISNDASRSLNFSYGLGQKQLGAAFNNSSVGLGASEPGNVKSAATIINFDALRNLTANFNMQIDALLSKGEARILTNPRIVAQNGKKANFVSAEQIPLIKTERTAVGTTQTVAFEPIGETIDVTPLLIDPESGFVTLEIAPNISSRGKEVIVGGNPVPEKLGRNINTTMKTRSGEAVVLAGLKRKSSTSGSSKVPLLGDIPFLGNLFGANSWTEKETDLIIMVTPYILDEGGRGNNEGSNTSLAK